MCRLVPSGIVRTSESTSSSGPSGHGQARLLLDLPGERLGRALAVLHAAPGQEPAALQGDGGRGPGQQEAPLGVAADAVGGDALALASGGHPADAGPESVRPPTPGQSTLAAARRARTERGAPVDTAAELEAIRRLKYAYFRTLDLKQFDDLGALLTEDVTASYEDGKTVLEGRDAIVTWLGVGPGRHRHGDRAPRPSSRDHLHLGRPRPRAPGTCRTGSSCRQPTSRSPGPPSTPTATG